MKVKSTIDYDIFKFRDDNREKIDLNHVKKIVESIKSVDLLEMRPISVNSDMEVMDGQHRLLAAKQLGRPIFYQVKESLCSKDIILMNISKSWTSTDYLNYYIKNGHECYINLKNFMKDNNITLKIALGLTMTQSREQQAKFRNGQYNFEPEAVKDDMVICWKTIDYIKKMNGYSAYTSSGRFWKALTILVRHSQFDQDKWASNLERMIEKLGPRARTEDYLKLFSEIHNWRNPLKLDLLET